MYVLIMSLYPLAIVLAWQQIKEQFTGMRSLSSENVIASAHGKQILAASAIASGSGALKLESLYTLRRMNVDIRSLPSVTRIASTSFGSVAMVVGKKKDRKRLEAASLNNQHRLESLQRQHRQLDEKVKRDTTSSYGKDSTAIKELKAAKLRLKDEIKRLTAQLSPELMETAGDEKATSTSPNSSSSSSDSAALAGITLGSGSFAKVLHGTNLATGLQVAIKLAKYPTDVNENDTCALELRQEYLILNRMKGQQGFPRPHYFGCQDVLHMGRMSVLVMDLLGPSLETLLFATTMGTRGFSSLTVLAIARQLITRLLSLQRIGVVHGDVHCGNVLMGLDRPIPSTKTNSSESTTHYQNSNQTVYLVDFGQSRALSSLRNTFTGNNKRARKEKNQGDAVVIGPAAVDVITTEASTKSNQPVEVDDLQALVLTLMNLLTGSIPKLDLSTELTYTVDLSHVNFSELVQHSTMSTCNPDERSPAMHLLSDMWSYRQSLRRGEHVDYAMLLSKVDAELHQHEIQLGSDFKFDWEEQGLHWTSDDGSVHHALY